MKTKKKKIVLYSLLSLFAAGAAGAGFVFGTEQGHSLREMAAGSVLSTQHPQYAKWILPQAELDDMQKLIVNPPVQQSTLAQIKPSAPSKTQVAEESAIPAGGLVSVETVEDANFTAKIMKISDPKTVHLVGTKYQGKGQPLSELISQNGAVAGINAGGFKDSGGNGSGGQIIGIAISSGKIISEADASRTASLLVGGFTKKGQFITGSYSANELLEKGVTEAVSFGPQLIVDGKDAVTTQVNSAYGWAPRTAIGQTPDGTVIMIATDGRYYWDKRHRGASMNDLVNLFQKCGAENALALDGGGSTTMIQNGQLLLKPATETSAGMRYLPNAFVVIPK